MEVFGRAKENGRPFTHGCRVCTVTLAACACIGAHSYVQYTPHEPPDRHQYRTQKQGKGRRRTTTSLRGSACDRDYRQLRLGRLGRDQRHYDIDFLTESTEEPEGVRSGDMRERRGARFSYSRECSCGWQSRNTKEYGEKVRGLALRRDEKRDERAVY